MPVRPVRRALLSVSDKTGIVELARGLAAQGAALVSTGGTARTLRDAGIEIVEVSDVTGFPEILDGRVKTLHPRIHGGILARRDDAAHRQTLEAHAIEAIDVVVAGLYPFEEAVASGAAGAELVEKIDVGGPAMIRAAAKNHADVAALVDPIDYASILAELQRLGGTSAATRRRLAAKAFARTAAYDAAIASWLAQETGENFPERLTISGRIRNILRYGENPHQQGAYYVTDERLPGLSTARQLQGKELSYNNLLDADAALAMVAEFDEPAVAIVKHANPCGVAVAADLAAAWTKALACDPVSAFGGVVALNRVLDGAIAVELAKLFLEVVVAPTVSDEAASLLGPKGNLRLLTTGGFAGPDLRRLTFRSIAGGLLAQEVDTGRLDASSLATVTTRSPTFTELKDLLFAWRVAKHVKSNAIVLARDGATVGIGMGQTSRVDAVWLAANRMVRGPGAGPCVVASDAFFPFPDGLIAAAEAGATAAIQPGGSRRDAGVIAAADERGLAMVFTAMRHFRH